MGIIVGYEKEKHEISCLRDMLHNSEKYREFGVRIPRGIALCGETGVGKTVLAKSIADDGIMMVQLHTADCCDDAAITEIKRVFAVAKDKAPSVILLDELDKIAGTSMNYLMEGNDNVKKTLLQELDDLSPEDVVLVVATCNDTECLGDALLRNGRFDRILHIDLPDEQTRRLILEEYFGHIKIQNDLDMGYLARITNGYTGAKLECLANEAGILAMEGQCRSIDMDTVRTVMNKLAFGSLEKNPMEDKEELRKIATHEAGHALTAMLLAPKCIFGASILPQGESNGHIQFINPEDNVGSFDDIENEVAVLLAGRVAERKCFGKCFLGSDSDLSRAATRLHYILVNGMAYGYETAATLVRIRCIDGIVSEKLKTGICEMLSDKMYELDEKVGNLLDAHEEEFKAIIEELMNKQTLSREELFAIMNSNTANT